MYKTKVTLKPEETLVDIITWARKFVKELFTWDQMPIPDNHHDYMEDVIEGYAELSDEVKQDLSLKVLDVINRSYIFAFKSKRDAQLFNARWNENKIAVVEEK